MLTKNFYSFMRLAFSGNNTPTSFTKTDGTTSSVQEIANAQLPFKVLKDWAPNSNSSGVCFGNGATPVTESDYVLESILTETQLNVSTPSAVSYSRGDTFDEYSVSFGVTNKISNPITISEVGLIARPFYSDRSNYTCTLVDRTLLDVPVTIQPNETKHIAYTIRFNY